MLTYPSINPIALSLGPLQIHWYGLMYLLGFLLAWGLGCKRALSSHTNWTVEHVGDVIFYGAIGVVLGGRIGYMVFYNLPSLLSNPLSLVKIWDGGMSFHGGLLGVIVALALFARHTQRHFLAVSDFVAPLVPLGLAAGRVGNFINGELWGRITDVPWAMVFPHVDNAPRHPSQLYEFGLEGLVLFTGLWIYSRQPRPLGRVSGMFLLAYSVLRCVAEYFRQPDPQYGYLAWNWLTMGQILSLPMFIAGLFLIIRAKHFAPLAD